MIRDSLDWIEAQNSLTNIARGWQRRLAVTSAP
jgi:hypothetical protein